MSRTEEVVVQGRDPRAGHAKRTAPNGRREYKKKNKQKKEDV